ncbi:hypothetical protein C8R43DRAFT_942593 [Mycena crocata]|nr:hypothetical protein C8R43DRAFT_942593 [Mycena crocata]
MARTHCEGCALDPLPPKGKYSTCQKRNYRFMRQCPTLNCPLCSEAFTRFEDNINICRHLENGHKELVSATEPFSDPEKVDTAVDPAETTETLQNLVDAIRQFTSIVPKPEAAEASGIIRVRRIQKTASRIRKRIPTEPAKTLQNLVDAGRGFTSVTPKPEASEASGTIRVRKIQKTASRIPKKLMLDCVEIPPFDISKWILPPFRPDLPKNPISPQEYPVDNEGGDENLFLNAQQERYPSWSPDSSHNLVSPRQNEEKGADRQAPSYFGESSDADGSPDPDIEMDYTLSSLDGQSFDYNGIGLKGALGLEDSSDDGSDVEIVPSPLCGEGITCPECMNGDLTARHICEINHPVTVSVQVVIGKRAAFLASIHRGFPDVCFKCPCGLSFAWSGDAEAHLESIKPKGGPTDLVKSTWLRKNTRQNIPDTAKERERSKRHPFDIASSVLGANDVARLDPKAFFNDELINFGLQYFLKQLEEEDSSLWEQVEVFSSFFQTTCEDKGLTSVATWAREFNFFNKKYIVIPVNENNVHWYLVIICHPRQTLLSRAEACGVDAIPLSSCSQIIAKFPDKVVRKKRKSHSEPLEPYVERLEYRPKIYILDSFSSTHTGHDVGENLNKFMKMEALLAQYTNMLFRPAVVIQLARRSISENFKVPQQPNGFDCGAYLLHFARIFIKNPEKCCTEMNENPKHSDLYQESVSMADFRKELKDIITSGKFLKKDRNAFMTRLRKRIEVIIAADRCE